MLQRSLCIALTVLIGASACKPVASTKQDSYTSLAHYTLPAVEIGKVDGVTIHEGGYSGLAFDQAGSLWAITDRGPNLECEARMGQAAKRFPVPGYHPHAELISLDTSTLGVVRTLGFYPPADSNTRKAATGLPMPAGRSKMKVEKAVGPSFERLGYDSNGIDSEGIAFGAGSLWISDEYRPSIWRLDPSTGSLIERYTPSPTEAYDQPLPKVLLQRRPNLGIEGLAFHNGYLYASLQGPLSPPTYDRLTPFVRILRLHVASGDVRMFAYELDASTRKIGDLAISKDGKLLVLEHGSARGATWSGAVYSIELKGLNFLAESGPVPEQFKNAATALTSGILATEKRLFLKLDQIGWSKTWKKPEGIAVDSTGRLYLINDNDFGLDSPAATGAAVPNGVQTHLLIVGKN